VITVWQSAGVALLFGGFSQRPRTVTTGVSDGKLELDAPADAGLVFNVGGAFGEVLPCPKAIVVMNTQAKPYFNDFKNSSRTHQGIKRILA
jgi:hypothetical protein